MPTICDYLTYICSIGIMSHGSNCKLRLQKTIAKNMGCVIFILSSTLMRISLSDTDIFINSLKKNENAENNHPLELWLLIEQKAIFFSLQSMTVLYFGYVYYISKLVYF